MPSSVRYVPALALLVGFICTFYSCESKSRSDHARMASYSLTILNGDRSELQFEAPVVVESIGKDGKVRLRFEGGGKWSQIRTSWEDGSKSQELDAHLLGQFLQDMGILEVEASLEGELLTSMYDHLDRFTREVDDWYGLGEDNLQRTILRENFMEDFHRICSWVDGCVIAMAVAQGRADFALNRWDMSLPIVEYPQIGADKRTPARIVILVRDQEVLVDLEYPVWDLKEMIGSDLTHEMLSDVDQSVVQYIVELDGSGAPTGVRSKTFYDTEHRMFSSAAGSGVWSKGVGYLPIGRK